MVPWILRKAYVRHANIQQTNGNVIVNIHASGRMQLRFGLIYDSKIAVRYIVCFSGCYSGWL